MQIRAPQETRVSLDAEHLGRAQPLLKIENSHRPHAYFKPVPPTAIAPIIFGSGNDWLPWLMSIVSRPVIHKQPHRLAPPRRRSFLFPIESVRNGVCTNTRWFSLGRNMSVLTRVRKCSPTDWRSTEISNYEPRSNVCGWNCIYFQTQRTDSRLIGCVYNVRHYEHTEIRRL